MSQAEERAQRAAFKEKVKRVIEAHGGGVDIGVIPGVYKQPKELQEKYLPGNVYAPIELVFDGEKFKIHTSLVGYIPRGAMKEYMKRLQAVMTILNEIEK